MSYKYEKKIQKETMQTGKRNNYINFKLHFKKKITQNKKEQAL